MLGYSNVKHEVYTLPKSKARKTTAKVEIDTKILRLSELTNNQWDQIKELQGFGAVLYLRWRYGSPETYILLAYLEDSLVHIEWIVPAKKIIGRYPFVDENSYSIISCLTSQAFRGMGIYPSQIQEVVNSDISTTNFWIWAALSNIPSLKGIRNAGGIKVGVFGFSKEYAKLNVIYSTKFKILIKMAYPLRNAVWAVCDKWTNSFLDNVSAVLKQESIRRSCM